MTGKVLITGANGMLGSDLVELFSNRLSPSLVVPKDRNQLDISRWQSVGAVFREVEPTVVINAAAYTNVDGAEKERELAYAVNVTGVANLVEWCQEYGAKLIHFSTDQVFDGATQTPRTEEELPKPLNYYAETKWLGEKEALRYPQSLVLRVQWLYGKKKDRFSPLKEKTLFTPFADQYGAPMPTAVIAQTVYELLEKNVSGLYHLSYDDYASWAEVFQFVKEYWKLNLTLEPKLTAQMNLPAKRPLFSVLSNEKLCRALGRPNFGSWKTALESFLK